MAATQAKQSDDTYDITVTWDAPNTENTRNATAGYDLEYKLDTANTWTSVTVSAIATVTHDIENVTASETYEIRMRAKSSTLNGAYSSTVSVAVGDDYDADDDGLIDVGNLARLNAVRYDLDAQRLGLLHGRDELPRRVHQRHARHGLPVGGLHRLRADGQPGLQHQQQRQERRQPHRRGLRRHLLELRQRLWSPIGGVSG